MNYPSSGQSKLGFERGVLVLKISDALLEIADAHVALSRRLAAPSHGGQLIVLRVLPDHGEREVPGIADIDDRQQQKSAG